MIKYSVSSRSSSLGNNSKPCKNKYIIIEITIILV